MRRRRFKIGVRIASWVGSLLLLLISAARAGAGDKASLDKIKAHYQAAAAAYDDGDFERTKSQLQEAIAIGKSNGLGSNKLIAQSYLLFGVLEVAGLKDPEAGVRYFAKALDISPAIQVSASMATKDVLAAFERAENQAPPPSDVSSSKEVSAKEASPKEASTKERSPPGEAEVEKEKPGPGAAEKKRQRARDDGDSKLVDELAQAKMSESQAETDKAKLQRDAQEKDKQLAESKGRIAQLEKEKQEQEKQVADAKGHLQQLDQQLNQLNKDKSDKERQLAESKTRVAQLEKEKQEQEKQLAATKETARKENEANDKLKKDKLDSDRQLADARARLQQVTKEKQESDQQLAAARDAIKRDHEANEKLEKAKTESDRQLADSKGRLQQLTKEKLETDRQLAATRDGEKKERENREKLEKVWQDNQARDKERKSRDEQARSEREKLADGPDLPSHFSEPIYCTIPDEIPAGVDLFVHCVPHQNVAAKVVALYYRAGGTVLYNATTMERSKKGWYTALIPGTRISGKLLHYYVEARDGRQAVAASNGKSSSPNIAMIRPPGAHGH